MTLIRFQWYITNPAKFGADRAGELLQVQTEHGADPTALRTGPSVDHALVGGGEDVATLITVLNPGLGQVVTFQGAVGFVFLLGDKVTVGVFGADYSTVYWQRQ